MERWQRASTVVKQSKIQSKVHCTSEMSSKTGQRAACVPAKAYHLMEISAGFPLLRRDDGWIFHGLRAVIFGRHKSGLGRAIRTRWSRREAALAGSVSPLSTGAKRALRAARPLPGMPRIQSRRERNPPTAAGRDLSARRDD